MTSTPPAYRTMISPRSRRLRTVGLILLVAAVTMALYGFLVLMPSLQHTVAAQPGLTAVHGIAGPVSLQSHRARRVAALKVVFAYGYWSVCGLLVIGMLFIAWLDMREVSRNYLNERRSVWLEAARTISHEKEE